MARTVFCAAGALSLVLLSGCALTVEEAEYEVLSEAENFELREYPGQIVAEVEVDAAMEAAGDQAFKPLFDYISGSNEAQTEISMTTPVLQKPAAEKIAMTTPVTQQRSETGWKVAFVMPDRYSMDTIPTPVDPAVTIREIPPRSMAAVEYSGRWTEAHYATHLAALQRWMKQNGYVAAGEPVWARYNPPITPWFLRRNEILIPIER